MFKKSVRLLLGVGLSLSMFFITNCANNSSKKSSTRANQGYCNPSVSMNCNYVNNFNGNSNQCGVNAVMTAYGCMSRGNCPANFGYDPQSNQCYPAVQYNNSQYNQQYGNQYQQGTYDPYSQYNSQYYNQNYNQNYNYQNTYDPYYNQNYYGY